MVLYGSRTGSFRPAPAASASAETGSLCHKVWVSMSLSLEAMIRLGAFVGVLVLLVGFEDAAPRRAMRVGRRRRWPANLSLALLNTLLLRLTFPAAAVGAAMLAEARGWGLLNLVPLPAWFEVGTSIVLLDLVVYGQHVLFHAVPMLWRLHRVHHADPELDATTGLRFHPLEILLSMSIKAGAVIALGAPVIAVLAFEIILNAGSMWSHANIRLPEPADRVLQRVLVTPDMHRTHHSVVRCETDSNFGFNLAWWDRLFGTYRERPAAGHEKMKLGIAGLGAPGELRLDRMLLQPLRSVAQREGD
jgi:sterol desaturase/sphingolipid hydroxylase (fatty acid hydroxylase superfamily)